MEARKTPGFFEKEKKKEGGPVRLSVDPVAPGVIRRADEITMVLLLFCRRVRLSHRWKEKERKEPLFNQSCSAYIFYGFSSCEPNSPLLLKRRASPHIARWLN